MAAREIDRARRNEEALVHKMENAARQTCGKVRAKVQRSVFGGVARKVHAWIFWRRGELDIRIRLVIAKYDVEFRAILLDEVVFERQRFALVAYDNGFEVGDLARQRTGFGVHPTRFEKVGTHAAAQVARFADVKDVVTGIFEEIDARTFRKLRGFFAGFHGHSKHNFTIARQLPSY